MKKAVFAFLAVALSAICLAAFAVPMPTPDVLQLGSFDVPSALQLAAVGMTTLAADKARAYELASIQELPMIASDIIYEGAAVGDNASGLARPLVAGDPFFGFAEATVDNSAGAASAKTVRVRTEGQVQLTVVGVASAADVSETVYASDDDTFTLTVGSNTPIGKVARWVTSTTCIVAFQALYKRSL